MNRIASTVATGLIASLSLAALLIAGTASAETTRKPRVCVAFEVIVDAAAARAKNTTMLGVCRDGKRPVLFTNWRPVTINDGTTDHTYTVGF